MSKQDKIVLSALGSSIIAVVVLSVMLGAATIPETEWRTYRQMTGKKILDEWSDKYFYAKYSMGSDGKKNKWDCSGAYEDYLWSKGAKFPKAKAFDHAKYLNKYGYKRLKIQDCKEGDVITFKKDSRGIGHVGVVVKIDLKLGKVFYVDVGSKENGMGFKSITFNNWRVFGIYFITQTAFYYDKYDG